MKERIRSGAVCERWGDPGRSSSVSIRPELSYLVTSYEVNDALVHGLAAQPAWFYDANQNTTLLIASA